MSILAQRPTAARADGAAAGVRAAGDMIMAIITSTTGFRVASG